jgi:XTP/dITP diphosphohydrolase
LVWENQTYYFEGICKGQILSNMQGENGFGYDPIFMPDGASKSFANMKMAEKNQFSHRKKAVAQLFEFLEKI